MLPEPHSADYRDDTGSQVCESLGTSNKMAARRLVMAILELDNRFTDSDSQEFMKILAADTMKKFQNNPQK